MAQYLRRLSKDIEMMQPLPPRLRKKKFWMKRAYAPTVSLTCETHRIHSSPNTPHPTPHTHTQFFLKKEKLAIILPFLDF